MPSAVASAPEVSGISVWLALIMVVRTPTGVVAYEAASGDSIGSSCGWEFGLHDSMYALTYGQSTVCEDDQP